MLMKKMQKILNRSSPEYKQMDKDINTKCGEAKEVWKGIKYEEIEQCKSTELSSMYKKIKELAGNKSRSSLGYIKARMGRTVIVEKGKILERWTEYIAEISTTTEVRNQSLWRK